MNKVTFLSTVLIAMLASCQPSPPSSEKNISTEPSNQIEIDTPRIKWVVDVAATELARTDAKISIKAGDISTGNDLREFIPLKIINNESKAIKGLEIYYREEEGDNIFSKNVGKFKISLKPKEEHELKVYNSSVVGRYQPIEFADGEFHEPPFKCPKVYYSDGTVRKFVSSYRRAPKNR